MRTKGGRGEILTFPDTLTTQGLFIPMVFQHSGGRDFDLPRHSHYSGVIPTCMVFQHRDPYPDSGDWSGSWLPCAGSGQKPFLFLVSSFDFSDHLLCN